MYVKHKDDNNMKMKDKVLMMVVLVVAIVAFNTPLFFMTDPLNRQAIYAGDLLFLMPMSIAYLVYLKFN